MISTMILELTTEKTPLAMLLFTVSPRTCRVDRPVSTVGWTVDDVDIPPANRPGGRHTPLTALRQYQYPTHSR
ncbi:hypothetical protein C495_11634 [Natronorubrum sulfidifaciens JCM 14089]|uniref:Uncharacterized protein n=1 Tax=Natronorubrum sulfidifaciens JCM 14089 TaxID=1230460 RepID=L9W531_9EURY|nr:hypothetical protein C495_11634 [Natronorubrum sulfidifaciens JCM 14089]